MIDAPLPAVSAVIPAHNPEPSRLRRTLLGLKAQISPGLRFEVIVVNNASERFPDAGFINECAPADTSVVNETRLGLTAARLAGFAAARGDLVVLVDDDNVLAPDYLRAACQVSVDFPFLASWSGNVELAFEPGAVPPPRIWRDYLTERTCTRAVWSNDPSHNDSTPWGAGMCIRRVLADKYRAHCLVDPSRLKLDLSGSQLVYGGDTDISYFGCSLGFGKGVFPQLKVSHIIPPERCERSYLLRAVEGRAYSEWLHHWVLHGAVPVEPRNLGANVKRGLRLALSDRDTRATERARSAGRARAARELGVPR
jgi:glycosyltransferase involved in cell wall biosynthesis